MPNLKLPLNLKIIWVCMKIETILGNTFFFKFILKSVRFDLFCDNIVLILLNDIDIQPRSQALSSCEAKTLVGAGHVTHRKLIA
jgi:hypothetical protein